VLIAGFRVLRVVVMRSADSFFYPYLKAFSGTGHISDRSLLFLSTAELAARVELLTAGNRELALQNKAAGTLREENRILRQMLNLQNRREHTFVVAEILLRDPLRFREAFTIGKGSRDGIVPGSAVVDVSPDGRLLLIGIISECGARTAKVMTIADPSLHIAGKVGANGAVGFTNTGNAVAGQGMIRFGMLPARNDYISGGAVLTAGFEQGIPEGLKIGELHFSGASIPGIGELDYSCELHPAVRFESLRFVAVLNRLEPGGESRK
jgi:rod shape-determining protein MreC